MEQSVYRRLFIGPSCGLDDLIVSWESKYNTK